MATREQLKAFFETGDYPTQGQFATLIDSFFIKGANDIAIADVAGLAAALASKGSAATVQQAYNMAAAALATVTPEVILPNDARLINTGGYIYRLTWDEALSAKFGTIERTFKVLFPAVDYGDGVTRYKQQTEISPVYEYNGANAVVSVLFELSIDTPFKIIITI